MRPHRLSPALKTALVQRLHQLATVPGNVPVGSGRLRNSHRVEGANSDQVRLIVQAPYARAVHEGRRKITVKPKRKKALFWKGARHPVRRVTLPPRRGNPWLARAAEQLRLELQTRGLSHIHPALPPRFAGPMTADAANNLINQLVSSLERSGFSIRRR